MAGLEAEATAALADVCGGLQDNGAGSRIVQPASADKVRLVVCTLEGEKLDVELTQQGYKVEGGQTFESLAALLSTVSERFKERFVQAVAESLQGLATESPPPAVKKTKYGVINCEDLPRWQDHMDIWTAAVGEHVTLQEFDAVKGHLPTKQQLEQELAGLIISGSHYSAADDLPWILELLQFVRDCCEQTPDVHIMGVCFGHQAVARALGGEVGVNPDGGFVLAGESLRLEEAAANHPATAHLSGEVRALESHGDCVRKLPPSAKRLAGSDTCENELYCVGDNVLCCQFHPEFEPEHLTKRIGPNVVKSGQVDQPVLDRLEKDLDTSPASVVALRDMIVRHLTNHRK